VFGAPASLPEGYVNLQDNVCDKSATHFDKMTTGNGLRVEAQNPSHNSRLARLLALLALAKAHTEALDQGQQLSLRQHCTNLTCAGSPVANSMSNRPLIADGLKRKVMRPIVS